MIYSTNGHGVRSFELAYRVWCTVEARFFSYVLDSNDSNIRNTQLYTINPRPKSRLKFFLPYKPRVMRLPILTLILKP